MIRKQIYITKEQNKRLKQIKEDKGIPEAVTVRKALERYLKDENN